MAEDLQGILVAKVTSMLVLGGLAFLITVLPVALSRLLTSNKFSKSSPHSDYVLSLFLSFGGGVLLCTTFLHLLPEVESNIETLKKTGKISDDFPLPLAELIMCCGFFMLYIVEELIQKFLNKRQSGNAHQEADNAFMVGAAEVGTTLAETYKEVLKQDVLTVTFSQPHEEDTQIFPKNSRKDYGTSCSSNAEVNHNQQEHCGHDHQHHELADSHHHHHFVPDEPPSLRELLIVLALSVHESFEGLAIGLESTAAAVWYLMTAVAVHKCVIAFCIGVELVCGRVSLLLSVLYALIYSTASPIGIGIGFLLTSTDKDDSTQLISAVLQGLATGTLLYVVFFEILRRDAHRRSGISQLLAVVAGFALMAVLTVIIDA